ncbi:hypothetical protein E2C01_053783 [Portunus trituberculatus]|uniref:Uncharacterized protein n=1 Tax=Portunus trituberculatus TaxID=210409 RepID=A0A5B7GQZ9_PORTR|nr:hypothetical protein [Portunus trituberculatus]
MTPLIALRPPHSHPGKKTKTTSSRFLLTLRRLEQTTNPAVTSEAVTSHFICPLAETNVLKDILLLYPPALVP